MSLSQVIGIVSGGASGLGAATAADIVRQGGRCIIADLPSQHHNFLRLAASSCAAATRTASHDGTVLAFAETDVTSEAQVSAALDLAEEHFGEPVNVCVSCAGIGMARKTLSRQKDDETMLKVHSLVDFSKALTVNTIGTFNLARLAAHRMARREPDPEGLRGCIVNTASIAGFEGQKGQVAYAASKGAVISMTLPLARDLASHGIRVMTIAPGLFKTPLLENLPEKVQAELGSMVPCPSRLGDPVEYSRLVVSILSNPMMNGETIRLDGAMRMPP